MVSPNTAGAAAGSKGGITLLWVLPGLIIRSWGWLLKNRGLQRAAVLSYCTLLGVIPLVLALILILQWFPVYHDLGHRASTLAFEHMQLHEIEILDPAGAGPAPILLVDHLDRLLENAFADFDRRLVMIASLVFSLLAALGVLSTLERGFGLIWHETGRRDLILRLINYWVLLTLTPLLVILGVFLLTRYQPTGLLRAHAGLEPFVLLLASVTVGFFVLYYILPKADVRVGSSLFSAVIVTGLLGLLVWGTGCYLTRCISSHHVYGLLGLLPLTLLGLLSGWLVILYGTQLTYAMQHLTERPAAVMGKGKKTPFMTNDVTVINILREITHSYEHYPVPVPSVQILGRLSIPECIGEKTLGAMVEAGYLIHASEPIQGYLPARDPRNIHLGDITAMVATVSYGQKGPAHTSIDHLVYEKQAAQARQAPLADVMEGPKAVRESGKTEEAEDGVA
jgi:YihY family inner membrane protein